MLFPITSIFAAVLAIVYILLSYNVHRLRKSNLIVFGDKGNDEILRASRAHGNFIEYVPFGLVLMLLVESTIYSTLDAYYVGLLLVIGRILHAFSLISYEPRHNSFIFRIAGTYTTFGAFGYAAFILASTWIHGMLL